MGFGFGSGWSSGARRRRRVNSRGTLTAAEIAALQSEVDGSDVATVAAAAGVSEGTITTLLGDGTVQRAARNKVRDYLEEL